MVSISILHCSVLNSPPTTADLSNRNLQTPHKITQLQYYTFLIQEPGQGHHNMTILGCRLFQEFSVDAYGQIDNGRLNWIRHNQDTLQVERYHGLVDAVEADLDLNQIGSSTILPSSFIGGPRQMSQLYHDAMAIVWSPGKPDLFITMTCNANWPEILEECQRYGQTLQDRLDIVA